MRQTEEVCETLTAAEVSAILGVTLPTFAKKRKAGQIPEPILDGRFPKWGRRQIEEWLAGGTRSSRG